MKIDYDKKHPFKSVKLIPECKEDEYLTEEQTARFKKAALRCVHISYACLFFAVFAFICEFIDLNNLLNASKTERILAVIGYVGLGCLIISIILLFIAGRKLNKLSKEFNGENKTDTDADNEKETK